MVQKSPRKRLPPARLVVESGPGVGQVLVLPNGDFAIGRSPSMQLCLDSKAVSRHHATLFRRGDRFVLRDEGSHNGTFVEGELIEGDVDLYPGDVLRIGQSTLRLAVGEDDSASMERAPRPWARIVVFAIAMLIGAATVAIAGVLLRPKSSTPAFEAAASTAAAAPQAAPEPGQSPLAAAPERDAPGDGRPLAAADDGEAQDDEAAAGVAPSPVSAAEVLANSKKRRPARQAASRAAETARSGRESPLPKDARVSKLYEAGEVDQALALAEKKGAHGLVSALREFKKERAAARAAISFKDGTEAVEHYQAALKLDGRLSPGGKSRPGREVRQQLSRLYQMAGTAALADDVQKAVTLLERAVQIDPQNAKARELLRRASTPDEE